MEFGRVIAKVNRVLNTVCQGSKGQGIENLRKRR